MKIGIDISQIVYGTGVSRYYKELIGELLKIDSKNEYILFGSSLRQTSKFTQFQNSLKEFSNVSFKVLKIPPIALEFLWNRLHIIRIEKIIGKIDIYHSSDWLEPPNSKITKKITTIHDMIVYLFPSTLDKRIVENHRRKLKWVKRESDFVLTNSETTRQDAIKFMDIPADKVKSINFAAASVFRPQTEEQINNVLDKYRIKKPYILSVGTQEPRKNISTLVDVFAKIYPDRPKTSLVLSGKHGWGRPIEAGTRVITTGYVPEEDLAALYSGCHVFVYPSLYEGFGLPILEAMACGAPVITSNNSAMLEISKDTAILIDPRSKGQLEKAIRFVLDMNLNDYQKLVRASLDRSRKYSWSKTAKETLAVYKQLQRENQDNGLIQST